jgi:hypothetical protein
VVPVDNELRALRHRIKNDLQLVGSLIRLDLSTTSDAAAKHALEAVDRRVIAITLSYVGDADGPSSLRAYLEQLCRALPEVALTCDGDPKLASTPLTRIGLIVSEICGTAPAGSVVNIATDGTGDGAKLRIEARRRARAEAGGGAWLTAFSRELVTSLVRQLHGTFEEPEADRIVVTVAP